MFVGKVIGTVWSTVKWQQLGGLKLLLVRPYHLADLRRQGEPATAAAASPQIDVEAVVCVDLLDAGVGDDVVVAFGHAARVAAQSWESAGASPSASRRADSAPDAPTTIPIDAAVVAVVDSFHVV